jgi:hypothetical protein
MTPRFLGLLTLLALTTCAVAQEPAFSKGTFKLPGNKIIVTDNIPPEKLPELVKQMTPEQFKSFAEQRNAAAYRDAQRRHLDYLDDRGPLLTADFTESSASHTTRFGGGVGVGGFGGAGGYSGYMGGVNYPYGYYPGGASNSNGGASGIGSGFTFQGNTIRTMDTANSKSWTQTYPDLNDGGGGPIMIINPFCFDFWKQHTE